MKQQTTTPMQFPNKITLKMSLILLSYVKTKNNFFSHFRNPKKMKQKNLRIAKKNNDRSKLDDIMGVEIEKCRLQKQECFENFEKSWNEGLEYRKQMDLKNEEHNEILKKIDFIANTQRRDDTNARRQLLQLQSEKLDIEEIIQNMTNNIQKIEKKEKELFAKYLHKFVFLFLFLFVFICIYLFFFVFVIFCIEFN